MPSFIPSTLTPKQEVIFSVLSYSFCSGSLVLLNKLTLHYLPFPSLVVVVQLIACVVMIYTAEFFNYVVVDKIQWQFVKPYLLYTFFFSTGVYCNMRSLNVSNVETVIVFRALSPCIVAFLDALFLGREWPSQRSWMGLITLVVGAYGYASFDEKFQTQGMSAYYWPLLYTIVIALEMAYGKKIVGSVDLKTKSGPVIYTNLLGILPMMALATVGNEYSKLWDMWWESTDYHLPPASIPLLILGCLVGTGIGYSGWWCRDVVSATSFTLIGGGIVCLFVCIGGGIIYKQSPMRNASKIAATSSDDDEIFKADLSVEMNNDDSSTPKASEMADLLEKQSGSAASKRRG